jgi:hypothetical protein
MDDTRELGEILMRTLARLSLLLCLTVMAVVFLVSGAHGTDATMFQLSWEGAARGYGTPHNVGSAITVGFLVFGISVLAMGVVSPRREDDEDDEDDEDEIESIVVVVHD